MSSWTTSVAQSLLIEWQILEKMAWAHITSREKEAQITEMTFPEAEVSNVAGIQLPRDYSSLSQYLSFLNQEVTNSHTQTLFCSFSFSTSADLESERIFWTIP